MVVTCAGCQRPIVDKFLLNVLDQVWHDTCVQCADCKRAMADKCFSRDGKIYCKDDFFRRYGAKCSGCHQGISPHDLVRKTMNRFYHLNCFTCMVCRRKLSTGEELYIFDENHFLCKEDFVKHKTSEADDVASETDNDIYSETALMSHNDVKLYDKELSDNNDFDDDDDEDDDGSRDVSSCHQAPSRDGPGDSKPSEGGLHSGAGAGAAADGPGGLKLSRAEVSSDAVDMETSDCSSFSHESNNNNINNSSNEKGSEFKESGSAAESSLPVGSTVGAKRRGPRTTIKAKQLETLKAAFAATPKPTRHIREQLAQETGLNMRVIQVWFQNRRSKERRLKQLSVLGARRQFFRSPRRLRLFRPGDDLIDAGPHDPMTAAAAAAAAFGYFAGTGSGDGAEFFAGYAPIYGDFYSSPGGMDPSTGTAAGALAFLPPSSGIGHQQQGQPTGSHIPPHLHEHLHHERLREGVYLAQRHTNAEGLDLPTGQPSPDAHLQSSGGPPPGPQLFQPILHSDFPFGSQGSIPTPDQMPALERLHPPQGVSHIQPPAHNQIATW